jgi:hypothetical protein
VIEDEKESIVYYWCIDYMPAGAWPTFVLGKETEG